MRPMFVLAVASLVMGVFVWPGQAQTTATDSRTVADALHPSRKHRRPTVEDRLVEIQAEFRAQTAKLQEEIDLLKAQLGTKQAENASLSQHVQAAQEQAATAQTEANASVQRSTAAIEQLRGEASSQNEATKTAIAQVQAQQKKVTAAIEEPASIHYKGITFTPGGFIAAESVWRQRALNADIYTNFNFTPYPSAGEAHTSEWVPSARQSRFSVLASGKVPFGTLRGMFEGDFLSAGTTSNNLQTNSYTLRVRQAWAQAEAGAYTFSAGQMWSLLTESKREALPGQEALPIIFDGNVHVGFTYIRQPGLRLQKVLAPGVTLAGALESSQYQFAATNAPSNFFFGAPGAAPGLNNSAFNYTNQVAPDVLAKLAFDPKYGHFEVGGVVRLFRDRYYPAGNATAQNDTKIGGGFVANARVHAGSKLDLGLHLVAGDGTGRFGASLLPDITVKPDGTLEPLRNAQGLLAIEVHPTKKLDLFGYMGTEYVQRTYYQNAAGTLTGYAPPSASNIGCFAEAPPTTGTGYSPGLGSCVGATRNLTEGSLGYVYRLYSGSAGKLQYGLAYSYLTRSGWTGVGGAPKAINNMVWTSFRYYIP